MPASRACKSVALLLALSLSSLSLQAAAPRKSMLSIEPSPSIPASDLISEVIPPAEVTRVPEELQALLAERVTGKSRKLETRLQLLSRFMHAADGLGLTYDDSRTRSIAETFAERRGNCVSFTLTFIELARLAGLQAHLQESETLQVAPARDGTLLFSGHVSATVWINKRTYEVDFDPVRPLLRGARQVVPNHRALAHFYNNRGAELMEAGLLMAADAQFAQAQAMDPALSVVRNNRAVLRIRQSDLAAAERQLIEGLQLDPDRLVLLSNLLSIQRTRGALSQVQALETRIAALQRRDPHHQFVLGMQKEHVGQHAAALEHYRLAVQLDEDAPQFRWALSRALQGVGDLEQARIEARLAVKLENPAPRRRNPPLTGGLVTRFHNANRYDFD